MFNRWQISILIFLGVALFIGSLIRIFNNKNNLHPEEQIQEEINKENIYVHISGEVKNPGVFKVKKNARLFEVVKKAGGFTNNADISNVNLAHFVKDGEKIIILPKKAEVIKDKKSEEITIEKRKININKADYEDLIALPSIGDKIANRIIEYRKENGEFKDIEELKLIKGIGHKNFKKLKELITVE